MPGLFWLGFYSIFGVKKTLFVTITLFIPGNIVDQTIRKFTACPFVPQFEAPFLNKNHYDIRGHFYICDNYGPAL